MKMIMKVLFAALTLLLALPFQAMAVTTSITTIMGSGQLDTNWTATSASGTQVGLRAHDSVTGATNLTGNTYSFAPGQIWNYDFSFSSGTAPLSAYTYSITVSGPSILGGTQTWSPTLYPDNSFGTVATANGAGVEGLFATFAGGNSVMQNSEKITFFPTNGNFATQGIYDISASMSLDGRVVNSEAIRVQVGEGGSVPEGGATIAMLAFGLGLIGLHQYGGSLKHLLFGGVAGTT